MEQIYERTVFYYETDQMGIVHHSNYIRWLEEARMDFLKKINLPYEEVEKRGILILVLGVACKYIRALRYGETYQIHTEIEKVSQVKLKLSYKIYEKESGILCATAETEHGLTDKNLKPVRTKRDYPEIYEKLISCL